MKKEVNVNGAFIEYILNANKNKINQAVRTYIGSPAYEKICVDRVTEAVASNLQKGAVDVKHIDNIIRITLDEINQILRFKPLEEPKKEPVEDNFNAAKEAVTKYLKYNNNFVDKDTLVSICGDSVKDLENSGIIVEIPEEGGYIAGEGYNE